MTVWRTEGPWVSHKCPITGGKNGFVIQNARSRGITIATLFPGLSTDRIEEVAEANARLIAAAPELLAELEFAVKLLRPLFGNTAQVERMDAVITAAKGEQS